KEWSDLKNAADPERVMNFDASGLALKILGRPIANTVLSGAAAALAGGFDEEDLKAGIKAVMKSSLVSKNESAAIEAFRFIKGLKRRIA
ncbi:MAG: 2-oxoacid:acceptor oxidoreductase family protein, partial [Succinatimonas hippei]|nr:2-oxoacid:acceptor oxidoreductase family protein [Succinatimonas hippei]